jgi:hypothetical protein
LRGALLLETSLVPPLAAAASLTPATWLVYVLHLPAQCEQSLWADDRST